jgi:hypothetical protein
LAAFEFVNDVPKSTHTGAFEQNGLEISTNTQPTDRSDQGQYVSARLATMAPPKNLTVSKLNRTTRRPVLVHGAADHKACRLPLALFALAEDTQRLQDGSNIGQRPLDRHDVCPVEISHCWPPV